MPTIYPSLSPAIPGAEVTRPGKARSPAATLPVSVGELLEVTVGEKVGPSRYLLSWKGFQFAAATDISLHSGEKLTVRLEQLHPGIVLRLGGQENPAALFADYLRDYRANPQALAEIFQRGQDVFGQQATDDLLSETGQQALANVKKLMEALLCSPESLKNPFFLKEYISKLGLLLERQWQAAVTQGKSAGPLPGDTLKGALLKLAAELQGILKGSVASEPDKFAQLSNLAKLTEEMVKAIETQQVVNVQVQENINKYLLQLPLFFHDGIKKGEIFIEGEKDQKAEKEGKNKFHVVMFLNMDRLGDIMVDASLAGNRIGCAFKFADPEARVFFSSFLEGLGDALRRAGYDCHYLTCSTGEDLQAERRACRRDIAGGEEGINVYI